MASIRIAQIVAPEGTFLGFARGITSRLLTVIEGFTKYLKLRESYSLPKNALAFNVSIADFPSTWIRKHMAVTHDEGVRCGVRNTSNLLVVPFSRSLIAITAGASIGYSVLDSVAMCLNDDRVRPTCP